MVNKRASAGVTHLPPGKPLLLSNLRLCKAGPSLYHLVLTSHQTFSCYNSPLFGPCLFNLLFKFVSSTIQQGCQVAQHYHPLDVTYAISQRKQQTVRDFTAIPRPPVEPPLPFASFFLWQIARISEPGDRQAYTPRQQ